MAEVPGSAWAAMQPHEVDRFGEVILDPEERRRWSGAIALGGLPYMWSTLAAVPRALFIEHLHLREDDRVLVVGEAIDGCGIADELRARVGDRGEVLVVDFMNTVRDLLMEGTRPQWEWDYASGYEDGSFDAVAVFQGTSHSADWRVTAPELVRVLRPEGALAIGEIVFGPPMARVVRQDLHATYLFTKIWEVLTPGQPLEDQVYWSLETLADAFGGLLTDTESFEWRGVELFWGRKPVEQSRGEE